MIKQITTEQHRRQIEVYMQEFPHYETYAGALKRVLEKACSLSIPEAVVQARAKSVSSFAEKCARKFNKYPDPVHQLTDLCGARVIVQTLEQVNAVRLFVEENFETLECDDKGLLLSENEFGYRDVHYLIRLKRESASRLEFTLMEQEAIGSRIAELQVRSVVQHAWADILHDRMYKTPLRLSADAKRTGALLAAIMEEGDRSFDRLATEIDGMVSNYTAYASRAEVEKEIAVQELIFANEQNPQKKARVALQLARLLGPCGRREQVVKILEPFADFRDAIRPALLLELGHALCRVHRAAPQSPNYERGQRYLEEVIALCTSVDLTVVPNLRKKNSLRARACSRLAWSWEAVPYSEAQALQYYRDALEKEPANPYHLANQLGFELFCHPTAPTIDGMRTNIREAIVICREHAEAGTELPYALFTAGRLSLLLGESSRALGWYARGLRHLFDGESCVSEDVLDDEVEWVKRLHRGAIKLPEDHDWIERLIMLGRTFNPGGAKVTMTRTAETGEQATAQVLVVAGGAGSMDPHTLGQVRPFLRKALECSTGIVISGGTAVGIPGCVGELAAELRITGQKKFELVGYIPKHLPVDSPKDSRYDRFVVVSGDSRFSPGQVLRTWEDLQRDRVTSDRVKVLGFGGGLVTATEFYVALSLGASVAVVAGTGGAADEILRDRIWNGVPTLLNIPPDVASVQAFVVSPNTMHAAGELLEMARFVHERYVKDNPGQLPENMHAWENLAETYRKANFEQAAYAVEILRDAGFDVRPASGAKDAITSFAGEAFKDSVNRMAELEHGRWNVERLREGWRFGNPRDNARKIHNCLVAWAELPEEIREYDRNSIRAFPEILAKAGWEICRKA